MSPCRRGPHVSIVLAGALLLGAAGCASPEHTRPDVPDVSAGSGLAAFGPAVAAWRIPPDVIADIAEHGAAGVARRPPPPGARAAANPGAERIAADRVVSRADGSAAAMAERSRAQRPVWLTPEQRARVQAALEARYRELAKDFVCSLALQYMSRDEQGAEAQLTSPADGSAPARARSFDFYAQSADAFAGIAQRAAWDVVAAILGPATTQLNAWAQWGKDVTDTATTALGGSASELSQPVDINGYQLTRAAYYYARVCLRPPH